MTPNSRALSKSWRDHLPAIDSRMRCSARRCMQACPARRRMRLHRQVAEALEVVHAHDLDIHVSELAYHYGEAQALPGQREVCALRVARR